MRHYDTLIVGAGSAGAVLASRLSEDPRRSVCLVEAGPDYLSIDQLPARVRGFEFSGEPYAGARLRSHEWQYTARASARRAEMPVPRGRAVGGSSSINGTVFLRALRSDLDNWATTLGTPAWSFERCLPTFRKLETDYDFDDDLHGRHGPIPVSRAARADWFPLSQAFFEACTAFGFDFCADMNRPDARGVGPIPTNYHQGVRYGTAVGYLIPSRPRDNLDVLAETLATRVCLEGRRACGVEVLRDGHLDALTADEVILSAGAIGSPHLLLLSGIGPAEQLQARGIQPVVDLPGVGQHIRDHPYVLTVWDGAFEPILTYPPPGLPWQVQLRATAPGSAYQDDGWLTMIMSTARDADGGRGFMIPCSLMYEDSLGTLRLQSADPRLPPLLDFNFLSEPTDLARLRDLARLGIAIGSHAAFDGLRAGLRQPTAADLQSDAAFDDWIARTITTGHHVSCTCRMGPPTDRLSVVDPAGRVHGLDNLRIIDASILPECPGVNLNATTIMLAEHLAATI